MEGANTASPEKKPDEISLLDVGLVLAENWRLLVPLPLAAGIVALGISFLIPPTYTATTRILPPAQQSTSAALAAQLGALTGLVGGALGVKNPADQYVALLKSRTVYDAIILRFNLKELYEAKYMEDARTALERRSRVVAGAKDGIISIEAEDNDPKRAAAIASAFVDELRNLTNMLAIGEAAQRRLFFERQLVQAKDNLTEAQIALQTSGVSESTLRTVPQAAVETIARLKAQITAQEIRLASMRTSMTETNPDFRLGLQELAALRSELSKTEESSPKTSERNGAEYVTRYRDFKYHETLFQLMAKQYELARLDEAREGSVIQVIDAAQPPERKSKPKKALIAVLTTFAAFWATVLFVFVRRSLQLISSQPEAAEKLQRIRGLFRLRRE